MNTLAQAQKRLPLGDRRVVASRSITNSDDARRVYVQSENRLDLAKLALAFADAPDCIDVAGKSINPDTDK